MCCGNRFQSCIQAAATLNTVIRTDGGSGRAACIPKAGIVLCISVYNQSMNNAEIIRRLEREGWRRVGGRGHHMKYRHPDKSGHVVVPHPGKSIATGMLHNIFRQAGWDWR